MFDSRFEILDSPVVKPHFLFLSLALTPSSWAQTFDYNETINGDLSNIYTAPTILFVGEGNNYLTGALTGGSSDLDMFRLVVPSNLQVTEIRLESFTGGGGGSFLLMQPGDILDAPPSNNYDIDANPIGYTILSSPGNGQNVLGFITLPGVDTIPPFFGQGALTEGNYAGWLNETGQGSTYRLNFVTETVVVPEPSFAFFPALAILAGLRRKRRPMNA